MKKRSLKKPKRKIVPISYRKRTLSELLLSIGSYKKRVNEMNRKNLSLNLALQDARCETTYQSDVIKNYARYLYNKIMNARVKLQGMAETVNEIVTDYNEIVNCLDVNWASESNFLQNHGSSPDLQFKECSERNEFPGCTFVNMKGSKNKNSSSPDLQYTTEHAVDVNFPNVLHSEPVVLPTSDSLNNNNIESNNTTLQCEDIELNISENSSNPIGCPLNHPDHQLNKPGKKEKMNMGIEKKKSEDKLCNVTVLSKDAHLNMEENSCESALFETNKSSDGTIVCDSSSDQNSKSSTKQKVGKLSLKGSKNCQNKPELDAYGKIDKDVLLREHYSQPSTHSKYKSSHKDLSYDSKFPHKNVQIKTKTSKQLDHATPAEDNMLILTDDQPKVKSHKKVTFSLKHKSPLSSPDETSKKSSIRSNKLLESSPVLKDVLNIEENLRGTLERRARVVTNYKEPNRVRKLRRD